MKLTLKEIRIPLPKSADPEIRKSVEHAEADMRDNFLAIQAALEEISRQVYHVE